MPLPQIDPAELRAEIDERHVHGTLVRSITDGTLIGGEHLRLEDICRWLHAAPIPASRALRRLEGEGLLRLDGSMITIEHFVQH